MSSLPVRRKKVNSCDAGNTLEPAGNQGGWGCCSRGLASSNVSTVFPQEGEGSHGGKKSLGEQRPRYESASQQQTEVKIRVKHKDQNDRVDKTPKSKDRTEEVDIKLHKLLPFPRPGAPC